MLAGVKLCGLLVGLLWFLVIPGDGRRIANTRNVAFRGRCYHPRTGIILSRTGIMRPIKKLCMEAVCFANYTMVINSCRNSTCIVRGVKFNTTYPDCCPQVLCKNGNRIRNLYTNATVDTAEFRKKAKKLQKKRNRKKKGKGKKFQQGKGANRTESVEDAVGAVNKTVI